MNRGQGMSKSDSRQQVKRPALHRSQNEPFREVTSLNDQDDFLAEAEVQAGLCSYSVNLVTGESHCSKSLVKLLGISENVHETFLRRMDRCSRQQIDESIAQLMIDGGTDESEVLFETEQHTWKRLRNRRRVTRDAEGRFAWLSCTLLDITMQGANAMPLENNEGRYETLFNLATDTFMLHAQGGVIVDVNQRACDSFGYSKENFIGKTPHFFSEALDEGRMDWLLNELAQGRSVAYDSVHRRKDGSTFPAEVRIRPVELDGRRFAVTLSRDITERKQAEMALRQSERRYRLALDTAEIGTWSYEAKSGIIRLDARAQQHWGVTHAELALADMYKLLHPSDYSKVVADFASALNPNSTNERVDLELRVITSDNSIRWLSVRSLVSFCETNDDRKWDSIIGTTIDVTEQRSAVIALEGHTRVAESIASGQPLNSILERITRFVEESIPDSICGILVVSEDREHLIYAAGDRYPESIRSLRVPIAQDVGSCGHAAWSREMTFSPDTATDVRWTSYRELANDFNARSSWSAPILEITQEDKPYQMRNVLGTLAVYRTMTGEPNERLISVMQTACRLAGIAISNNRVMIDLREGEARYAVVSEISRIVTFGLTKKPGQRWQFLWSRPQVGMLSGYSREELLEIGWEGLIHAADHAKCEKLLGDITTERSSKAEVRLVTKSGQILHVQIHAKLYAEDRVTGVVTLIGGLMDITELKAVESALRKSEERFQLALSGSNDGLWDWNIEKNELFYSPRWKTMLGFDANELGSNYETWTSLLHPDDLELSEKRLKDFLASDARNYEIEFRMRHKDGGYRIIQSKGTLTRDPSGVPIRMVGTHRDLTERAQAEQALRRSEEFLRRAQMMANVGNWTLDMETQIFECSEEAARIFELDGPTCTLGEWLAMVHHDDLPRLRRAYAEMLAGVPFDLEYRIVIRNRMKWVSSKASLEVSGAFPTPHLVGVTQDISSRTKLEEQLRQSQKMDAFGQLAGGVAHDFNNLLTVINGFSELLLAELPKNESRREYVEQIQQAGDRAAALTRQLLTLGRRQFTEPRVIDLNEIIVRSETMLKRLIGENIFVQTDLESGLPNIKADPGQVDQVILNLAVNARDAMPNGGSLKIETRVQKIDSTNSTHTELAPGEYVLFVVSDSGVGMSDEVKSRIFEPFYSTKGVGKGTGLGLSTVYGIVKQSQASIAVESTVGVGTKFQIWFPVVNEEATKAEPFSAIAPATRGRGTILVAEDEDIVRHIVVTTLEAQGYTVLAANSGEAALEVASQHQGQLPLLITDMVMPGITGTELAARLRVRHKDLRVLYMSGYTDDKFVRYGLVAAPDDFIQKPFTPTMLNRIVHELLKSVAASEH